VNASYPDTRPRRLRTAEFVRALVRETRLAPAQLIQPLFAAEGVLKGPIASMPGQSRLDLDELVRECAELQKLGIAAVALFPVIPPALKNELGSESLNPEGLIPRAVRAVKSGCPGLGVIVDIALDPYTNHATTAYSTLPATSKTTSPSKPCASRPWCWPAPAPTCWRPPT